MKIGIIAASGKAGSMIMKEAVDREHDVTAIVRDPGKITEDKATVVEKDIFDITAEDLNNYDIVVNAFGAPAGKEEQHVEAGRVLINALKDAPNTKLIVVGGAGSLYIDDEKSTQLMETPDFPEPALPTARSQSINLDDLLHADDITWTFVSPSAFFDPEGKRTGSYQTGEDNLLVNNTGESYISYADFAAAVLDEIENPKHINERFTVVSEVG